MFWEGREVSLDFDKEKEQQRKFIDFRPACQFEDKMVEFLNDDIMKAWMKSRKGVRYLRIF